MERVPKYPLDRERGRLRETLGEPNLYITKKSGKL